MNNVSLIGRLTADPELRNTQSGISFVRFCIAVDRSYSKQGEEKQTDFINVVAWRQSAEFICKLISLPKSWNSAKLRRAAATPIYTATVNMRMCPRTRIFPSDFFSQYLTTGG